MKQFKMNERQRFSIRKFSIGAASVLLGSVFFVANPATEVQAAEASTEVISQDGNANTGNPSVFPPSDTSSQNPSVGQAGTEAETQGTEKKEQDSLVEGTELKSVSEVKKSEKSGEEKVDGGTKPVSGELSTVSEVEKDKKEAQPESEEKSSIIKEEANREDKIDQSQEEDGYQLYDKLIDASKSLKESNPESAADFKNLADTINEKLGLSDDGKISGELVEKAHKLLDGNQIDKAEIEGANNSRRRGKRDTELTDVQIGLTKGQGFDSSNIRVVPPGQGYIAKNLQVKIVSKNEKIKGITVDTTNYQGENFFDKHTKDGINTKQATLSFEGRTPKGEGVIKITVTGESGKTKSFSFGYYQPLQQPTITAINRTQNDNNKPEVNITVAKYLSLPGDSKMKVYLVRNGEQYGIYDQDYHRSGGKKEGVNAYPSNYEIIATAEVGENGKAIITADNYVSGKDIGSGKVKAVTVLEMSGKVNDTDPGDRGSWFSDEVTVPVLTPQIDRSSAIKAVEDKLGLVESEIGKQTALEESERTAAIVKAKAEAQKAKDEINKASTNDSVGQAKTAGLVSLSKEEALAVVDNTLRAKDQTISDNSGLTTEEKTKVKSSTKAAADHAKEEINKADKNTEELVSQAKTAGVSAINSVAIPTETEKGKAIKAVEVAAFAKKTEISNRFDLTSEDKSRALQQVDQEAKDAKTAVDKGVTNKDVEQAKVAGIDAINNINPQPSPRPLPTPQPQPSTPTQPDQGATETPTAPSEPAPQPSQPTAPGQPASPAPVPSSAPTQAPRVAASSSASSTSTQAPAQEQVDKSELRALTQELDQRLKALATVSDPKIDAAKAVLLDAQKALEDSALTEQGLRTAVESVKVALDSLKDVKANASDSKPTQDKKDAKQGTEDSKDSDKMAETNSVPAGVIVASLLALLGVIAFWLVRRKKESEIQQLSTELTKVLGQLDAEKADKKVLAKAKNLLQETLDFVKEENGSVETEAKLVEELKAILAKLK